jgi:predicted outer membrane repeat protein
MEILSESVRSVVSFPNEPEEVCDERSVQMPKRSLQNPNPYLECEMKGKWTLLGSILAVLLLTLSPASAVRAGGVRYAAPDGLSSGSCLSWANACTLQHALAVAVSGDEIWVKKGVYYPGANRADTFTLKNGVALYGGFAGTETMRDQRNWQVNKTILSGDIDQNDTNTDRNNIAETWNDIQGANAYHVVTGSSTDNTTVLDGFVITAGQANGSPWPKNIGGGMYNFSSSPTLTNVTFSGNSAGFGGGMGNESSSPTLTNVTFNGNSASYGGGMENYFSSNPRLTNVTFSGNSAGSAGGGMDNERSSPTLTNVTFSGNTANFGGGMENYNSSNLTLTNVTFSGNSAAVYGGGMYNDSSSPTLTNVIMWGNTATNDGQGIYNIASNPTISYSNIQNCGSSSGFWVIACGTDGGGNIAGDPRFEDADGADNTPGTADDNLRLQLTSHCIDAGKNAAVPPGVTTDLDGNPRFVDIPTVPDTGSGTPPIVDMGAYEARLKVFLPLVLRNF